MVQQCGHISRPWSWWYEIVTSFSFAEPLKLSSEEMKEVAKSDFTKITLGKEYGIERAQEYEIAYGHQTIRTNPIGNVIHDYSANGRAYCIYEPWRDKMGNDHPQAFVLTTYSISLQKKSSQVINNKVSIEMDVGKCEIKDDEDTKHCFNEYSGVNHWISREEKGSNKNCDYLPTRTDLVTGKLLTDEHGEKIFQSDQAKVVFKLDKEAVELCSCLQNFKTNYEHIYLRMSSVCPSLDTHILPPLSLNLDYNTNLKLDWLQFTSKNETKFVYEHLLTDIQKTQFQGLKHFFALSRKIETFSLFQVQDNLFGKVRGDVLSILKCNQNQYEVLSKPNFCTNTIQVKAKNETLYIEHGSRLVLESSQEVDCELEGDIFEALDQRGKKVYLTQEESLQKYERVSGKLNETNLVSIGVDISSALTYDSFDKSGLYDPTFLERRREYLFRGDQYYEMTRKVTRSFYHNSQDWKNQKNQNINFLDYISNNSLLDTVLGSFWIRAIKDFLGVVSYFSSAAFLLQCIWYIIKEYRKHSRVNEFVDDIEKNVKRKHRLSALHAFKND